jgi:polyisoprenoid-binding protein YceI
MKKSIVTLLFLFSITFGFAQKKTTTSAVVAFDATTSLDNLPKAENKTAVAALDTKTGDLAFEVTVKSFSFANPMMQEHFNSKGWMDSDQFPLATFNGKITNLGDIDFSKDGVYYADVVGDLSIHGQTNRASSKATIKVEGGKIHSMTDFTIKLDDYKVDGGAIAAGKVNKEPKVSVSASF